MIKAIALTAFTHGPLNLRRGEEAEFSPPTFTALAAHGLVREASAPQAEQPAPAQRTQRTQRTQRAARAPSNKKAPEPDNKAAADATAPTTAPAPDAATDPATPPAVEAEPAPAADPAAPAGKPDAAAHA